MTHTMYLYRVAEKNDAGKESGWSLRRMIGSMLVTRKYLYVDLKVDSSVKIDVSRFHFSS